MERLEKAEDKISASEYLLKGGFYEDSISRSYYAMFHAAKAALEDEGVQAKTHSGLILMIGKKFVKQNRMEVNWVRLSLWQRKIGRPLTTTFR